MKTFIDIFYGIEYAQMFPMAKRAGFDGFFSGECYANDKNALKEIEHLAYLHNLEWETSHSTIPKSTTIWLEGNEGDEYCKVLLSNLDNCKQYKIPLLVVHVAPDFSKNPSFELGIKRLMPVVEYAKKAGIKIAFENINSADYLFKTLEFFTDSHVGFCYDCGHEACYEPNVRFLAKVGNRLFCTHLHDNDGKGDCHWLPFDGAINFEQIGKELKACGYKGNLTLELCYNDEYCKKYTKEEFVREAYDRVQRLKNMIEN